jgi:Protein kinase domain
MNDDVTELRTDTPLPRAAESRFTPGAIVADRYRIVSLLGGGGMGEVYRADDLKLGQRVALKYVPAHDAAALERLYSEVRVGRQIAHPNVCRLYDIVDVAGQHFITMEYVDGEDLASLLRRIGRLPADKALALTRDLCAGLAAAHDRGFIHRDLKPANVMIDGRGNARITDFGLAGLADEVRSHGGTPLYMAPEQLDANIATPRSDIYALGLVLFEMFTGRRVFAAQTVQELRAQHASTKARPTSIVQDIDPAVERVILRCLEEDPSLRPASAHEILLALPGSDPLRAAVAAGETPSPEMVAAAGKRGELSVPGAWALLALALIMIAAMALTRERVDLTSRVAEIKSPDVLNDRASSVLRRLGYPRAPYAHGAFLRASRNERDAPFGPDALPYLYRDSPQPLVPRNEYSIIRRNDPPLIEPGMTSLLLDAEGKLLELRRVAPRHATPAKTFSWKLAFDEAGLNPAEFRAVAPQWTAPVASDTRAAWICDRDALRVEAASAAGRPVWFAVMKPGATPFADDTPRGRNAMAVLLLGVLIAASFFARKNVVRGRADARGALRVAAFAMLASLFAALSVAHHQPAPGDEFTVLTVIAGGAFYIGFVAWVGYLAIEPYFRRRWPHLLVGWTRVLAGRFRDPLVGTEVLLGLAAGGAAYAFADSIVLATGGFVMRNSLAATALHSRAGVVHAPLLALATAVGYGVGLALLLVVTRLLFRRDALAWLVTLLICVAGTTLGPQWIVANTMFTVMVLLALRFGGLLGVVAAFFCAYTAAWNPLTFSLDRWYFGRSAIALLILAALAVQAFRVSLAGKPLFGTALVEDEATV